MGEVWSSWYGQNLVLKQQHFILKSMQLAVHLSTCYMIKLEILNQTLIFP